VVRAQVPSRGDIYHLDLSPSASREQRGKHSVVVVSNRQYNYATGMPFVAPITTIGTASNAAAMAVNLTGAGTSLTGTIQVDQTKPLDLRARAATTQGEKVPDFVMAEILDILAGIFGPEEPVPARR
jgi:mRNA-degrading endonuclease toxin of MazEF toxin-antitoxin module